ncbi:MAG: hypothetical protein Q8R07_00995 [Candidatus Uhrbacteria bacterium]|nr:hypothetical protein [Candidatus Uhrbacteria bacterium]
MKSINKSLAKVGLVVSGFVLPRMSVLAAKGGFLSGEFLGSTVENTGIPGSDVKDPSALLPQLIGQIINVGLSVIGLLLLVYLLYAGYLWMTSGGDEEGVKKAKVMIRNAVIGLVIITLSAVVSSFVISRLSGAVMIKK